MNDLYVVPVSIMLILLGSLTFRRFTAGSPDGARFLFRRSGRVALMGLLLTLSYVLLVPAIYMWVERFSPLSNGTDVVGKCLALVAVALLGEHLSYTYNATSALRWHIGTRGAIAIGIAAFGLFVTTFLADAPDPSPQLAAYADQTPVEINTWIMLAYVAYIATPLIIPIAKDARRNPLVIGQWGSALIAIGFTLSVVRAFAYFPLELPLGPGAFLWFMMVSYASTACVALGLWAFAISRRRKLPSKKLTVGLSID